LKTTAKIVLLVIFNGILLSGKAQRELDYWAFGSAASFTLKSGIPRVLNDCNSFSSAFNGSVSDSLGRLLFYTDAINIWNRKHQLMDGYTRNSFQGRFNAYILLKPGSTHIYYIFSTSGTGTSKSVYYSIVDMNAANGLGKVTLLCATLKDNAIIAGVAPHCNGRDAWVIVKPQNTDEYHSYLFSDGGLDFGAITSSGGNAITANMRDSKVSVSGKRIVIATEEGIQLSKFNSGTGSVVETIDLASDSLDFPGMGQISYIGSVEIAPNDEWLYYTCFDSDTCPRDEAMGQTNIKNFVTDTVYSKRRAVFQQFLPWQKNIFYSFHEGLQLASNGSIYIAGNASAWLSEIGNPNTPGFSSACAFGQKTVNLKGRTAQGKLTTQYVGYLFPKRKIKSETACDGSVYRFFELTDNSNVDSVHWNFGDPASGAANTGSGYSLGHTFSGTGVYAITALVYKTPDEYCGLVVDTLRQRTFAGKFTVSLGSDTILCNKPEYLLTPSSLPAAGYYLWNDTLYANTFTANQPGTYIVKGFFGTCDASDTIHIDFFRRPVFDLGPDSYLCKGDTVRLNVNTPGATYKWQDGSTDSIYLATQPGRYTVEVKNFCGTVRDAITINSSRCVLNVPTAFSPNRDGVNDVFGGLGSEGFQYYRLTVYNRFGQPVFKSSNALEGWDGTLKGLNQQPGVFIWIIEYKKKNTDVLKREKGTVVLVR
jgi:gliding motility-associated-like protein